MPARAEIQRLERALPGTTVVVPVREGMRLSKLLDQDSYSYQVAVIYTAAATQPELLARYRRCVAALRFEIDGAPARAVAGARAVPAEGRAPRTGRHGAPPPGEATGSRRPPPHGTTSHSGAAKVSSRRISATARR